MEFRAAAEKQDPDSPTDQGITWRSVPEYSHVRTKIIEEREENINDLENNVEYIANEKYEALNYLDFTGMVLFQL